MLGKYTLDTDIAQFDEYYAWYLVIHTANSDFMQRNLVFIHALCYFNNYW